MSIFQRKLKKFFDKISNFSQRFTKLPKKIKETKPKNCHGYLMNMQNSLQICKRSVVFSSDLQATASKVSFFQ